VIPVAAALTAAIASAAVDHSLDPIVLTPQQVGPGYHAKLQAGGRRLGRYATLGLCGFQSATEGLRTARLQLVYDKGRGYLGFSNEVVRYSGNGALQALAAARHAAMHCPHHRVRSGLVGVPPATYRFRIFSGPGLEPDSVGMLIRTDTRVHGKRERYWNAAIYQVRGHLLSGVYTFRKSAAAQRRGALRLAAKSAENLDAATP
jgi:hypothetical protein